MNKMRAISIIWGIFLLSMLLMLTAASKKYLKKIEPYERLENVLENTTQKYVEDKLELEKGTTVIKSEELMDEEYLTELKVNEDNCIGYVVVEYNSDKEYKGYIKCNNYKTKNYDKNLK